MPTTPLFRRLRVLLPALVLLISFGLGLGARMQNKKQFSVTAHKYGFKVDGDGSEIHVKQDDLVLITFSTEDIPHSFTLEDETYRIMRRAEPGKPVTVEFRADKPGRFPFKCTLTADPRCKEMEGWLVVEGKN